MVRKAPLKSIDGVVEGRRYTQVTETTGFYPAASDAAPLGKTRKPHA